MSVATQYPQYAPRLESFHGDDTQMDLAATKSPSFESSAVANSRAGGNPFAQYPDGEGKQASADSRRLAQAALKRAKPRTRQQQAYHNLRAAGVDPDHRVDVRSLFIPAAFGPVRLTIPLPFTVYQQPLWEFYMERDKLSPDALPAPRQPGPAAGAEVPAHVATAWAKLADSLKDQFDSEFEKHKEAVGDHVAQLVDASISLYGKRHGIDMADACVVVSRAQRRITSIDYPKSENADDPLPPYPNLTLDDKESDGYFVAIDTPAGTHRYFLSLADVTEVPLPPDADVDAWSRENAKRVFGEESTLVDSLYAGALARAYLGDDFSRRVEAKLVEEGLDADDPDIRRGMEGLLGAVAQYQVLGELTREYLASAAVSYRPAV